MTHPDPTVLFHIGLHKTGTTWLQNQVFSPQDGRRFVYSEDRELIRGNLSVINPQFFDPETAKLDYVPLIQRAADKGIPLILSDELLGGLPFHHAFTRVIAAQNIKSVFPNAKILVTIREQAKIIYSSYGHYIRGGYSARFEDFLAQPTGEMAKLFNPILNLDHFDYHQLLLFYERLFGAGNVMVAPMEWMLKNQSDLTDRLSEFIGSPVDPVPQEASSRKINPAWSGPALNAARRVNRLSAQDARWTRAPRIKGNAVAWWVDRFTPASVAEKAKARSLDKIRQSVGARYTQSNQDLSARIGIDLGAFGYAV